MTIQFTAFRWVPSFAQGWVRDLRIRWALEEAGLPYEVILVDGETQNYRDWQPFGQVPAYRDDEVEMFESGAIVLRLAAMSEKLAPRTEAGLARVSTWIFAALNSIEPQAQTLVQLDGFYAGQAWTEGRRPSAQANLDARLTSLSNALGDKDYLEGRFTAGDILMATVLRELEECGALKKFPNLDAYRARCLARRAFAKALEDQLQTFRENEPA
ncbi:glutathione S-transferase family protein [Phenylobacterium sp. 20VBR1]|uniref:Glutathione S-transferase family protein n=1 Tax=Phenylobacterium glaciei TaxID=2803784 RepID=A0A941D079_9CAUL|nr:glutathione S-transferase family protein [Phenylobacterium glaciei]MBR7618431.1 glutathione S-transferase family protein [Phenylobacterium glaciei]